MKKVLLIIIFLFSSIAFAQSTDKIILVSDVTTVDMLVAKAAGDKTGTPVLVLENGSLTEDVKAELQSLKIKTVILIGGPAVIKPETETALEDSGYTVVRLWGMERTHTAIEVAKYFWTDAACVVLAEDTKSSESDTELQTDASQLASASNCPFFPVPKGKVPQSVLDILSGLGAQDAVFVGISPEEFRTKLSHLRQREITGDRQNEIESETENKTRSENSTLRLVVIAAPHWKHVLGYGGHSGRHTIVRIVQSADAALGLAEMIKSRNITDVSILGFPALAEDLAARLEADNITVTKISGERASGVAIETLRKNMDRWQERRKQAFNEEAEAHMRNKIKKRLNVLANEFETELNRLETEIAANASNATKLLKSKIDSAQSQLSAIRDYILNSNFETARNRMTRLLSEIKRIRWLYRMELNIDVQNEVNKEEK